MMQKNTTGMRFFLELKFKNNNKNLRSLAVILISDFFFTYIFFLHIYIFTYIYFTYILSEHFYC